jgi:hypothetical protein
VANKLAVSANYQPNPRNIFIKPMTLGRTQQQNIMLDCRRVDSKSQLALRRTAAGSRLTGSMPNPYIHDPHLPAG